MLSSTPVAPVASFVFGDPVLAGEPGVEHAVRDVARHLLRADQHALDLGIVDGREVRPRADVDVEAGAREQLHRRVLQRAFRDAELEFHRIPRHAPRRPSACELRRSRCARRCGRRCRRRAASPSPAPCRRRSRSRISTTSSLLPDVSPFIHSVLRVRLKKVAKPVRRVSASAVFVHEADHQHLGAVGVLDDRRESSRPVLSSP